ncbi:MAG: ABC transporter ATP-binding protein [Christensenellales bacterium]
MTPVIHLERLTKYYGKARGIKDVSFDVREGELFGFIGPNGAGKSTTIRTLLGLLYPSSGSATVFGQDCVKFGHEIRRKVGYLPSEVSYYDGMRVNDLLRYSASFYQGVDSQRLKALCDAMDLDVTRKIDDLSYGNRKKVGIVQGLLHRPSLLILDEPTSGLDPLMQKTFFELILEENRLGASVLMSSHILPEVQKLCTRVAIIKEGSLIAVEDIATLRNTAYKKIHLEFAQDFPETLAGEPGVSAFLREGQEAGFLYAGDVNVILRLLSAWQLKNLSIQEPDLEEIFLHYYARGEAAGG